MKTAALILSVLALAHAAHAATPGKIQQQAAVTGLHINLMRDPRLDGQRVAVLERDWLYCFPPTRELFLVPRSYVTDFASIPRFARHVIEPYGDNAEGAIVHDWIYAVSEPGQRAKADEILRYALKEQKVGWLTRNLIWISVRLGGGKPYVRASEWDTRFGDPNLGQPLAHSPFQKRKTAVVGVFDQPCPRMDDDAILTQLYKKYRSADWPPAQGAAPAAPPAPSGTPD